MESKMHHYSGYTVPLNPSEVYSLMEFGALKRGEVELNFSEFILHSYLNGDVQYEAHIENIIYMFTEADLQSCKACRPGQFKENDEVIYHLSDYQVYQLQTQGYLKVFDQDHDEDMVRISNFQRYNLGSNFRYVTWVGDILVYFYESDKTELEL